MNQVIQELVAQKKDIDHKLSSNITLSDDDTLILFLYSLLEESLTSGAKNE